MSRSWAWVVLGFCAVSCGDSAPLSPPDGDGGSGAGGTAGAGGSVHTGGRIGSGGTAAGGYGGRPLSGGSTGLGGSNTGGLDFPTGGKSVDPSKPERNRGWIYVDADGGAVCQPVPVSPVYEYLPMRRAGTSSGCTDWHGDVRPNVVIALVYPPGSHVAIPRPSADGCGPVVCECRAQTLALPATYFDWACPE